MRCKRTELSLYYLISAFLQQAFYKLPVCLRNYRWREVRQFGLSNSAAQIPGFLDILLYWGRKLTNTDKSASETTLPREKGKLICRTHPCAMRRKGSHPLSALYWALSVLVHCELNPHSCYLTSITTYIAEQQKHNTNCQGYLDA